MKKITLFYLTLLASYSLPAQLTVDDIRVDSIYIETEHPTFLMSILDSTAKYIYHYDSDPKLHSSTENYNRPFGATIWTESFQTLVTYNADDQFLTQETGFWNGGSYDPSVLEEYEYNSDKLNDCIYSKIYDGSMFIPSSRVKISYNGDDQETERRIENWNFIDLDYDYSYLTTQTYDVNGYRTMIVDSTHNGTGWDPTFRGTFTFENDKDKSGIYESHNGSSWELSTQYNNEYNGDDLDTATFQEHNGVGWENQSFYKYLYDSNGFGNKTEISEWRDDGGGGFEWALSSRFTAFYSSLLSVDKSKFDNLKLYPNPFQNEFNISLENALSDDGDLTLFNVRGVQISKHNLISGTKKVTISNPHLSSGVYFVKINSGTSSETFKIVKQ